MSRRAARAGTLRTVVVGAGLAGTRVALELRAAGYPGDIVMVGNERHPPYDRPPLSKDILSGKRDDGALLFAADHFANQRIELRLGVRVAAIDRTRHCVACDDGSTLAYTTLILATGLRSRPLYSLDPGERLYHLRTLDDALALRERLRAGPRVVVVGGGLLGLEVAATARGMGCSVTVIERHPALVYQTVAPVVGDYVAALHRRHGVDIRTGVTPRAITVRNGNDAARVVVELSDGTFVDADIVVAATGSIVNAELAEACGLEVDDGIIVNAQGRTSDPAIYAVGDVARHFNALLQRTIRVESWHNAQNQPAAVARAIVGDARPYAELPWFWSDQYDMNLQIIGYPSDWDRVIVRGDPRGPRFTVLYLQDERLVAANTINNGRDIHVARECIAQRHRMQVARLGDRRQPFELEAMVSA
ncbi:MAG TPA: FAD-dependent oxidoreductase [Casimicrobiaceae bacterium]|nr:FAD-dependent oxidoreductase [Casimicrobiaceae bacterium]